MHKENIREDEFIANNVAEALKAFVTKNTSVTIVVLSSIERCLLAVRIIVTP